MATSLPDRTRFNIPVSQFLVDLLSENYPDLSVGEGSVVHDLLIRPASLMLQPHRDYIRLMARNMKLRNYQVMNQTELDALASNFLVTRRAGERARGVQRVFFREPQAVQILTSARFSDNAGNTFAPISAQSFTTSQILANLYAPTAEYYVDISVVAINAGEEGMAAAGTVNKVQGITGAIRTINEQGFTAGKNEDSNTELYLRILNSVTNRDLVKKTGIKSVIMDAFDSVRNVEVVGYGDPEMRRDVIEASVDMKELFRTSYCEKFNLPLDENGDISFIDSAGNTVVTPVGGRVGAIVDKLDLDYRALEVTLNGSTYQTLAVQPGFMLRIFSPENDQDIGDFRITRVLTGPTQVGGIDKTLILVDRPFETISSVGEAVDRFRYTIVGAVTTNVLHVGGKIDAYVDSSANVERTVTIPVLTNVAGAIETDANGVSAIQLDAPATVFEGGLKFDTPVITIAKIEQLESGSDAVIRTLVPDTHYVLVRKENRGQYTLAESDVLIIRGQTDTGAVMFNGSRIRVTYVTNADYATIQNYVDSDDNRDVTKDITILPPQIIQVNVDLSYRGTASAADVAAIIREYLAEKSFAAEISVNEIVSLLAFFNVTDIRMPVTLTSSREIGNGELEVLTSQDRLQAGRIQVFRAASNLTITKLG